MKYRRTRTRNEIQIGNSRIRPIRGLPSKGENPEWQMIGAFVPSGTYEPERYPELEALKRKLRLQVFESKEHS